MKILALEAYYGGSHKHFLDSLVEHSRHDWTIETLPPYKWKWRMRHSSLSFAEIVNGKYQNDKFDLLFTSDMLNLAEFKGLANENISKLPSVIYFHENQFTYPVRFEKERDLYFGLVNFLSAVSANEIWFNSNYHLNSFYEAVRNFYKRMPDYPQEELIEMAANKSKVFYPVLDELSSVKIKETKSPTLLWSARWEHDKNPNLFFETLFELENENIDYKLNVIGESFEDSPEIFNQAKEKLAHRIDRWGFQPSREEYIKTLQESDIIISTADHEFYGISVLEAVSAGCFPILPNKLSYPELFDYQNNSDCFYNGDSKSLLKKLKDTIANYSDQVRWKTKTEPLLDITDNLQWIELIENYDNRLEEIAGMK